MRNNGRPACLAETPPPTLRGPPHKDESEKGGRLIKQLEDALVLTEELNDPTTGYQIERALDEARAQQFRPPSVA
jgi:hypothetical protein